jgi:hypothetical protein
MFKPLATIGTKYLGPLLARSGVPPEPEGAKQPALPGSPYTPYSDKPALPESPYSRMRKNPRRTLRTSRTKAYRRDTKTNYTAVKEMGWGFLAFRLFLQPSTQEKS